MKTAYRYRSYIAFNDMQLWRSFRSGDMNAFGALYHHHYRLLYNYGYTIFADKDIVKDCLQELFLELWERRGHLSEVSHIKYYLLVAFRRKIIHFLKKKDRLNTIPLPEQTEDFQPSLEDQLIEHERQFIFSGQFKKAFDQLPFRRKEAIYLRYYQELSYSQITAVMEIQYQTVRDLISKGIKMLKEQLSQTVA